MIPQLARGDAQSRGARPRRLRLPLSFEPQAGGKGLLRSDGSRRKRRVEIRPRNRFTLGESLGEKHREAADERVAGTGRVLRRDLEAGDELDDVLRREKGAL